jgi:putative heme iron utilization protein
MSENPQRAAQSPVQADIHEYIIQHPGAWAIDIAAALGCTEAQALSALSDMAWELPADYMPELLREVAVWGRVMVLIRNADAVAEVEVAADGSYLNGDWLNWIGETHNLHIRVGATRRILALVRSGKREPTYSFNLVNRAGHVFCRFYTRTPAAAERFMAFCSRSGARSL